MWYQLRRLPRSESIENSAHLWKWHTDLPRQCAVDVSWSQAAFQENLNCPAKGNTPTPADVHDISIKRLTENIINSFINFFLIKRK